MSEQKDNLHFPVNLERLALLLHELPLTQTELADQLCTSASEISKWKSGDRPISSKALKSLCNMAVCNPLWLLGLSDHRQPEITWRQLEITQASGKIDKTAQTLLLAVLESVNEGKSKAMTEQLGELFLKALAPKSD